MEILSYIEEIAICFGRYLLFIVPAATFLIVLHFAFGVGNEIFRKLLHMVAFLSPVVIIQLTDSWVVASLTLVVFAAIIYPILKALEVWKEYNALFVQRKSGEVKKSLLLLFLSDAAWVAIFWGIFGLPFIAVTAILMWGFGDASAALIGKRFGKHKIKLPLADPNKSWEGSCVMAMVSAAVGTLAMMLTTSMPLQTCLLFAAITAVFGAYTELITHGGNDTVTVPAVNAAVLLVLHSLL